MQAIVITDDRGSKTNTYNSGDVVAVFDDAHVFSAREIAHAFWRIVSVPGLPASAVREFLQPGRADNGMRRGLRVSMPAVHRLRASNAGVVTLTPREAFEALTAPEVVDAD